MKDYLFNLAMIDALTFCKANGIDPSGSHLLKYPRRQDYTLVRDEDSRALVTTTFHRRSVPTHVIHSH